MANRPAKELTAHDRNSYSSQSPKRVPLVKALHILTFRCPKWRLLAGDWRLNPKIAPACHWKIKIAADHSDT